MAFKDGQHYIDDDIQIRIITCYNSTPTFLNQNCAKLLWCLS